MVVCDLCGERAEYRCSVSVLAVPLAQPDNGKETVLRMVDLCQTHYRDFEQKVRTAVYPLTRRIPPETT